METSIQKYLDGAVEVLKNFGLKVKEEPSVLTGLLGKIASLDEAKVMALGKVLNYESSFNGLVRENVREMHVGTRYEGVITKFDSIVTDANMLVHELDDGKIDKKEKAQNLWMKIVRGTTHHRFEDIRKIHESVSVETKNQLDREEAIRDAYSNFRLAYQDARTLAAELFVMQEAKLKTAQEEAKLATDAITTYMAQANKEEVQVTRLQKARDERNLDLNREDSNYQLLKDMKEGLSNGYNIGETLIAKLMQTHEAKNQVYRKNAIFFTTNEHVFTTLDAVLTSQMGLHEATQELEAEKRVLNKGMEAVADLGSNLEKAALKAGYGSTTDPTSVQRLVDAIVNYQIESRQLIKQYRDESTSVNKQVEAIVEDGKSKVAQIAQKYN